LEKGLSLTTQALSSREEIKLLDLELEKMKADNSRIVNEMLLEFANPAIDAEGREILRQNLLMMFLDQVLTLPENLVSDRLVTREVLFSLNPSDGFIAQVAQSRPSLSGENFYAAPSLPNTTGSMMDDSFGFPGLKTIDSTQYAGPSDGIPFSATNIIPDLFGSDDFDDHENLAQESKRPRPEKVGAFRIVGIYEEAAGTKKSLDDLRLEVTNLFTTTGLVNEMSGISRLINTIFSQEDCRSERSLSLILGQMNRAFSITSVDDAKHAAHSAVDSIGLSKCRDEYNLFVQSLLPNCFGIDVFINENKTLEITADGSNQNWKVEGSVGNQILSMLSKHSELLGFNDISERVDALKQQDKSPNVTTYNVAYRGAFSGDPSKGSR